MIFFLVHFMLIVQIFSLYIELIPLMILIFLQNFMIMFLIILEEKLFGESSKKI